MLQNGTLKIIDRKKHIFKLAQGEYIAPEKIENIYLRSEPVAQVFVHGESLQVCICSPNMFRVDVLIMLRNKKMYLSLDIVMVKLKAQVKLN